MLAAAYLLGESGSGKTTLAAKLASEGLYTVVTGDLVLHDAAFRLCPYIKPGLTMHTHLWQVLSAYSNLRSAFRRAIEERYPGLRQASKPILAEATLFCLDELHREFQHALTDLVPGVGEAELYWLDTTPENLVARIKGRGLLNEQNVDCAEAVKRLDFFARCMNGRGAVQSFDSDELAETLRRRVRSTGP